MSQKNTKKKDSASKKNRKKSKKSKSYFKIGMLIYISILSIAIVAVFILLWSSLSKYQKKIDSDKSNEAYEKECRRAPQTAFENYLNNMTEDDWINIWKNSQPFVLDSDATIRSYINENITGKELTAWKSPTYTDDKPVYLVSNDERLVATFILSGSGTNYTVDFIDLNLSTNEAGEIEVPSECIVSCNGMTIDKTSFATTVSGNNIKKYNDELRDEFTYDHYSLSGLINTPDFVVTSGNDKYGIALDLNNRYYLTLLDSSAQQFKQQADAFIKSLLHYYSMGKQSLSENMVSAVSHVANGSDAEKVIRNSKDGVQWCNPDGANYVTTPSDVYVIADNCYCVDISYQNLNATTEEEKETIYTYRVFFLDLGNGYKIYTFSLM